MKRNWNYIDSEIVANFIICSMESLALFPGRLLLHFLAHT